MKSGLSSLLESVKENSKLLTREEEFSLIAKAQIGFKSKEKLEALEKQEGFDPSDASVQRYLENIYIGEEAEHELIYSNQRLVISMAKKYIRSNESLEDLIQEGTFGIYTAIKKFDLERGNCFSTYATPWIRATINRYISTNSRSIRIPYHISELSTKYKRVYSELESEIGREPTHSELAAALDVPIKKLKQLLSYITPTTSLDLTVSDSNTTRNDTFGDTIPTSEDLERDVENNEIKLIMSEAVKVLDEREKDILFSYLGINKDDGKREYKSSIAKRYDLNSPQLNAVIAKAEKKLKNELSKSGISSF